MFNLSYNSFFNDIKGFTNFRVELSAHFIYTEKSPKL